MIADFEDSIEKYGPAHYRKLFWEAGMVGQVLYLEAEAHGVRATGIGTLTYLLALLTISQAASLMTKCTTCLECIARNFNRCITLLWEDLWKIRD